MKLPVLTAYFEGYTVPERYKEIASCMIRRFNITGAADGMYICNSLAVDSGCGDGHGNFTGDDVKIDKCTDFLKYAYGCNIFPEDIEELKDILKTGELTPSVAVPRIRSYARMMRREKPLERGGRYTENYIRTTVHNAADAIDELTGSLPAGYVPNYYTPGRLLENI